MFSTDGTADGKGTIMVQLQRKFYSGSFPKFEAVSASIILDHHEANMRMAVQEHHNLGCCSTNYWRFENFPKDKDEAAKYSNRGRVVIEGYVVGNDQIYLLRNGKFFYRV